MVGLIKNQTIVKSAHFVRLPVVLGSQCVQTAPAEGPFLQKQSAFLGTYRENIETVQTPLNKLSANETNLNRSHRR